MVFYPRRGEITEKFEKNDYRIACADIYVEQAAPRIFAQWQDFKNRLEIPNHNPEFYFSGLLQESKIFEITADGAQAFDFDAIKEKFPREHKDLTYDAVLEAKKYFYWNENEFKDLNGNQVLLPLEHHIEELLESKKNLFIYQNILSENAL